MPDPDTTDIQTPRFRRSAAEEIRERTFPIVVRGYDRRAVDEFVQEVAGLVAELEGRQSRETIVQRALNEVGEETAGILQRAHETADEIAARSRTQADGRIQRAEREADIIRREAEEFSERVVADTRTLWDERQRLIEEIRQLADEVLATADDAAERMGLPEGIVDDEPSTTVPIPLQPAAELPSEEPALGEFDAPVTGFDDDTGEDEVGYEQPGTPFLEEATGEADDQQTEIHDRPTAEVELDVLEGGAHAHPDAGARNADEPTDGERPER